MSGLKPSSSRVEPREVLIVGGGIAGIEALMALDDLGDSRLGLRVVAAHASFVLRPQMVGEPWGGPPMHIDLERLCRAFGAAFTLGTVTRVAPGAHVVETADGRSLDFERLLLAPGAQPELPYEATRALGFGPLPVNLARSVSGSVAIVVPDGVGWTLPAYELALLSATERRTVRVITGERAALEAFGPATHEAVAAFLAEHGVTVDLRSAPAKGERVDFLADTVIALPRLHGPRLSGPAHDAGGFLLVDGHMAVRGVTDVFAAGDATFLTPAQGGLAAQQADVAAASIVRSCGGRVPDTVYEPVLRGKLTTAKGKTLFLRRALDGLDAGQSSPEALWQPDTVVWAPRLARWLSYRRAELESFTLDHVATPPAPALL